MTLDTGPIDGEAERLWTAADGTICILATGETPPLYSVCLVRNARVVRERRLYGRASAQVVAQAWRQTVNANQGSGISSGDGTNHCR